MKTKTKWFVSANWTMGKTIRLSIKEFESLTKPGLYKDMMNLLAELASNDKVEIEEEKNVMTGNSYLLFHSPPSAQMPIGLADIGDYPKLDERMGLKSGELEMKKTENMDIINKLIKMADRFDQEGKLDLAQKVDETILSLAARKKAPLKKMDEKVKHNLLNFVMDAKDKVGASVDNLEELFRRLRYFDVLDATKGTKLDKTLSDMKSVHLCLCDAGDKMFEVCFGRKPSKSDLEKLKKNKEEKEDNAEDTFEFARKDKPTLPPTNVPDEPEPDVSDEELLEFMGEENAFEDDAADNKGIPPYQYEQLEECIEQGMSFEECKEKIPSLLKENYEEAKAKFGE